MIEDLPVSDLEAPEIRRRLACLERQLRHGVPEARIPHMVAVVQWCRVRLGLPVSQTVEARARSRAIVSKVMRAGATQEDFERLAQYTQQSRPPRLEERSLPDTVPGMMLRLRQLQTTSKVSARAEAIRARIREIERFLGVSPREWAALRVAVERVDRCGFELSLASPMTAEEWSERVKAQRQCLAAWKRAHQIIDRIQRLGGGVARAGALEAYRKIIRVSDERVRLLAPRAVPRIQAAPGEARAVKQVSLDGLEAREYLRWWDLYREFEELWPIE